MPTTYLLPVLVLGLALAACESGGMRLPRLRARGWVGLAREAIDVGGEVGFVMPLDPAFAPVTTPEPEDDEPPEPHVVVSGRPAPCRVPATCAWERMEGARALARLEEGEPP